MAKQISILTILLTLLSICILVQQSKKPQSAEDADSTHGSRINTAASTDKNLIPEASSAPLVKLEEAQALAIEMVAPSSKTAVTATENLMDLMPDWLLEDGDVHSEVTTVEGQSVRRIRSRLNWEDGEQLEVEISDLGENASEDQFKSLGFDLNLEAEDNETNYRMFKDSEDYHTNIEYNESDQAGSAQFIVAGRYMMEVQIEGFPYEAFQEMEDHNALLANIIQYAAE